MRDLERYPDEGPIVSCGIEASEFIDELEIPVGALVDFYTGLPHPKKPPLSSLHIHFCSEPNIETRGLFVRLDRQTRRLIPRQWPEIESPEDTQNLIIVFLRPVVSNDEPAQLSHTLTHELTHLAQTGIGVSWFKTSYTRDVLRGFRYIGERIQEEKRGMSVESFAARALGVNVNPVHPEVKRRISRFLNSLYVDDPLEVDARNHQAAIPGIHIEYQSPLPA